MCRPPTSLQGARTGRFKHYRLLFMATHLDRRYRLQKLITASATTRLNLAARSLWYWVAPPSTELRRERGHTILTAFQDLYSPQSASTTCRLRRRTWSTKCASPATRMYRSHSLQGPR